mmetsp:Transcript_41344/g.127783  ORF Transcript_41344/g.127783 Transcript_41344/m.127783 type:complete len:256 (-) Transcript_41344:51-818(-)
MKRRQADYPVHRRGVRHPQDGSAKPWVPAGNRSMLLLTASSTPIRALANRGSTSSHRLCSSTESVVSERSSTVACPKNNGTLYRQLWNYSGAIPCTSRRRSMPWTSKRFSACNAVSRPPRTWMSRECGGGNCLPRLKAAWKPAKIASRKNRHSQKPPKLLGRSHGTSQGPWTRFARCVTNCVRPRQTANTSLLITQHTETGDTARSKCTSKLRLTTPSAVLTQLSSGAWTPHECCWPRMAPSIERCARAKATPRN